MAWVLAQGLDAREAFNLSTEFRLASLFEANTGYQPVLSWGCHDICYHRVTLSWGPGETGVREIV